MARGLALALLYLDFASFTIAAPVCFDVKRLSSSTRGFMLAYAPTIALFLLQVHRHSSPSSSPGSTWIETTSIAILLLLSDALFMSSLCAMWTQQLKLPAIFSHPPPPLAERKSPNAEEQRQLVTSGPYALLRHPLYVAYMLAWVGGALLARGRGGTAPIAVAVAAVYVVAGINEEKELAGRPGIGERYEVYRRSTAAWVPGVRW